MTPKDRFMACLHRKPADRASVGNAVSAATVHLMDQSGCSFPDAHLDPDVMAGLAATSFEVLGYDTIAPVFSVQHDASALGCEIDWGRRDMMPDVVRPLWAQPEEIRIPEDFLKRPACQVVLEAIRRLRQRYPDVAVIGKVFGPWTLAYHTFGVQEFLIRTLDAPDGVREILRRLKEVAVIFGRAQLEAGADAITLADHATGDLVSAPMYRDMLWRIHCELATRIPGPTILHICGNTADRLAYIAHTGLTCFHFDSKVPAEKARSIVDAEAAVGGPRTITLMGNINNPQTLLKGTVADVQREVAECLRCEIEIISPECAVPLTTPTENLRAVAEAVERA